MNVKCAFISEIQESWSFPVILEAETLAYWPSCSLEIFYVFVSFLTFMGDGRVSA